MNNYMFLALVGIVAGAVLPVTAATLDQEFVKAHERMYTNGMTQYAEIDAYHHEDRVTREQAAKFFVVFDRDIREKTEETEVLCLYTDSSSFDPTLEASIQSACNRGLMRWIDSAFLPQLPLTKAQAIAILMRSLKGKQDETTSPRWNSYYLLAYEKGLTKETNVRTLDRPVTRYELALLLWRSSFVVPDEEDRERVLPDSSPDDE